MRRGVRCPCIAVIPGVALVLGTSVPAGHWYKKGRAGPLVSFGHEVSGHCCPPVSCLRPLSCLLAVQCPTLTLLSPMLTVLAPVLVTLLVNLRDPTTALMVLPRLLMPLTCIHMSLLLMLAKHLAAMLFERAKQVPC